MRVASTSRRSAGLRPESLRNLSAVSLSSTGRGQTSWPLALLDENRAGRRMDPGPDPSAACGRDWPSGGRLKSTP